MVEIITAFFGAGLIIFFGFFGEWIFRKTNIPDALWLMLVGVLIGPIMHWVAPGDIAGAAPFFITFALLFMLFEGGLHLRLRDLLRGMTSAMLLTFTNFLITVAVITMLSILFGWSMQIGLLLGIILGGTSSAVVIPMLRQLNIRKQTSLILTIESAVSDVLVIVVAVTAVDIIASEFFSLADLLNSLLGSFSIAILVGAVAGLAWLQLERRFKKIRLFYMVTIGILLVLYSAVAFITKIDGAGAIATLSFGIVLGNYRRFFHTTNESLEKELSDASHETEQIFGQITFFLKTFFFVYIGILVDFSEPILILLAAAMTLLLIALRPLAVHVSRYKTYATDKTVMASLIPKGLAAAVLVQVPAQAGIAGTEPLQAVVHGVIFFSILFGTILVFAIRYLGYRGFLLGAVLEEEKGRNIGVMDKKGRARHA